MMNINIRFSLPPSMVVALVLGLVGLLALG
jgi:hypothetical protein